MDTSPEARLRELGIEIPEPAPSVANYVGAVRVGELLFVSGHGPYQNGGYVYLGKLGRDLDVAAGQVSARIVMLNFLATVRAVLGSLDRVERIVKLLVMVNSDPGAVVAGQGAGARLAEDARNLADTSWGARRPSVQRYSR